MESYSESYKKAGVDVTAALQKSMEKKTKRDSKRHINNPKLNDHGGEYFTVQQVRCRSGEV